MYSYKTNTAIKFKTRISEEMSEMLRSLFKIVFVYWLSHEYLFLTLGLMFVSLINFLNAYKFRQYNLYRRKSITNTTS